MLSASYHFTILLYPTLYVLPSYYICHYYLPSIICILLSYYSLLYLTIPYYILSYYIYYLHSDIGIIYVLPSYYTCYHFLHATISTFLSTSILYLLTYQPATSHYIYSTTFYYLTISLPLHSILFPAASTSSDATACSISYQTVILCFYGIVLYLPFYTILYACTVTHAIICYILLC